MIDEKGLRWRYAPWEDGSLPDGEAMIFCDGWETAVAGPMDIATAKLIVDAHNEALFAYEAAKPKEAEATCAEIAQVQPAAPGMPGEEEITGLLCGFVPTLDSSQEAARAILSLIRPAFEVKEREALRRQTTALAQAQDWRNEAEKAERRALSAEAKLAQAVEALATLETHFQGLIGMAEQSKLYARRQCARAAASAVRGEKT